jgi:hypothetical protein
MQTVQIYSEQFNVLMDKLNSTINNIENLFNLQLIIKQNSLILIILCGLLVMTSIALFISSRG